MRGTSNSNARGNTRDRLARRRWLLQNWASNLDKYVWKLNAPGTVGRLVTVRTCRCYRCGELLTLEEITVDRIIPGCRGGRYVRNNIHPACARCNSEQGGALRGGDRGAR